MSQTNTIIAIIVVLSVLAIGLLILFIIRCKHRRLQNRISSYRLQRAQQSQQSHEPQLLQNPLLPSQQFEQTHRVLRSQDHLLQSRLIHRLLQSEQSQQSQQTRQAIESQRIYYMNTYDSDDGHVELFPHRDNDANETTNINRRNATSNDSSNLISNANLRHINNKTNIEGDIRTKLLRITKLSAANEYLAAFETYLLFYHEDALSKEKSIYFSVYWLAEVYPKNNKIKQYIFDHCLTAEEKSNYDINMVISKKTLIWHNFIEKWHNYHHVVTDLTLEAIVDKYTFSYISAYFRVMLDSDLRITFLGTLLLIKYGKSTLGTEDIINKFKRYMPVDDWVNDVLNEILEIKDRTNEMDILIDEYTNSILSYLKIQMT